MIDLSPLWDKASQCTIRWREGSEIVGGEEGSQTEGEVGEEEDHEGGSEEGEVVDPSEVSFELDMDVSAELFIGE